MGRALGQFNKTGMMGMGAMRTAGSQSSSAIPWGGAISMRPRAGTASSFSGMSRVNSMSGGGYTTPAGRSVAGMIGRPSVPTGMSSMTRAGMGGMMRVPSSSSGGVKGFTNGGGMANVSAGTAGTAGLKGMARARATMPKKIYNPNSVMGSRPQLEGMLNRAKKQSYRPKLRV